MRCNWLLEQRGVEADDLSIISSLHTHMIVSFEPQTNKGWGVSGSSFTATEVAKVVVLSLPLTQWSMRSINEARREKRKCGNHYRDGGGGSLVWLSVRALLAYLLN